jgi:hypothetical protein
VGLLPSGCALVAAGHEVVVVTSILDGPHPLGVTTDDGDHRVLAFSLLHAHIPADLILNGAGRFVDVVTQAVERLRLHVVRHV